MDFKGISSLVPLTLTNKNISAKKKKTLVLYAHVSFLKWLVYWRWCFTCVHIDVFAFLQKENVVPCLFPAVLVRKPLVFITILKGETCRLFWSVLQACSFDPAKQLCPLDWGLFQALVRPPLDSPRTWFSTTNDTRVDKKHFIPDKVRTNTNFVAKADTMPMIRFLRVAYARPKFGLPPGGLQVNADLRESVE